MTILLFGASGTAGASVLRACLRAPRVAEVRAIVRRPLDVAHDKLRVVIHSDYLDYSAVTDAFAGVTACLFCLGVSVTQVSGEAEYRSVSHDFPLAAARALRAASPDAVLHYISGRGTDEHGRMMWARVKGETERELIEQYGGVCWRLAALDARPVARAPWQFKLARPLIWLARPFRNLYVPELDLGRAMLQATVEGIRGRIIENAELRDIADRAVEGI